MLQSVFFVLFSFLHPFYVSITEINHNAKAGTLEISSRIPMTDFEKVLETENNQKINIVKPADSKKLDQFIAGYISKHLIINVNGKNVPINYAGYEIEEDGAWCYFEVLNIHNVNQLTIKNDILYRYFPTQINMMHITVKGVRKSVRLNNPDNEASFTF